MTRLSVSTFFATFTLVALLGVVWIASAGPVSATLAKDQNPLHELMEDINGNVRKLRRQVDDPAQKDSTLAIIAELQDQIINCLLETPDTATDKPSAERPLFVIGYRRMMADVYIALLDMEKAVREGDMPKAKAMYSTLGTLKKNGHEQYKGDDE